MSIHLQPLAIKPPGVFRGPSASLPKKTKTSSACISCKNSKVKCSGQQPCATCVKKNLECVVDPESDGRRRIQINRKLDSLEGDHELFVRLLRTLRHQNQNVEKLLNYIREGKPSLPEIKQFMDRELPPREVIETPELIHIDEEVSCGPQGPIPRSAYRALDISRLCDIPPFTGPAHPWTTVTDDNDFVSHLISLYFTWPHLFFNWIDRDLFLKDFRSGDLNSTFCSPFLVNAMLAEACYYSDYPESCAVPGDIATKGEHFWREAMKLLDAEEGQISLTTVQGIGVMYSCASAMGKDRLGWIYLVRATKAVPVLRSTRHELLGNVDLPEPVITRLLDRLELGLFSSTVLSCLCHQRRPPMDKPTHIRLPVHQGGGKEWFPYPRQVDPVPAAHTNCVINQRAALGEIAWDLSYGLFGDDARSPRADMKELATLCYGRLLQWNNDLPECMRCTDDSVPEVLSLHMCYHTLIMSTFSFFKTPVPDADQTAFEFVSRAQQTCISSARIVSDLVDIHMTRWGTERETVPDIHWIYTALFILIDDLNEEKSHNAFLHLAKAALSFGRRWLLTKGMFRLVQIATNQANGFLPPDIIGLFKEFERRLWRPEDRRHFSRAYPNVAAKLRQQDDRLI
ncbi:hypothetical protein ETB97_012216 [Aspergillus alliaceus]|uniref:Zn(2)-C6 fungal-type domain-containing protein n=1 Tax=Petromyces alliaceus TaxID=209559 RepID=A0A8H6A8D5_PETAA|nr:hypothetical protein ETB97_012216 [Aspergillus burnettii]